MFDLIPPDDEHVLDRCGQLHALYNQTDEQIQLFMFGGYD